MIAMITEACGMTISRRQAPIGAAAVTAAAIPATAATAATAEPPDRGRIDTHHHVLPAPVKKWLVDIGVLPPHGGPPWAQWDLQTTVKVMNANNIALGVASMPAPTMLFSDEKTARDGVRLLNDSVAQLVGHNPTRFGHFAYISHVHIDLALEQIAYAFDKLGANGVLLMNTVDGKYLGDPQFDPILAELNRRHAVIFTHPDSLPGKQIEPPGIDTYIADFMLDTTRNALSLLKADALRRHPNISVILSHSGGMLPYITGRVERAGARGEGPDPEALWHGVRHFYYDTAAPLAAQSSPTLLATVDPHRILFGTDWSQVPASDVAAETSHIDRDRNIGRGLRQAIYRDNARRLLFGGSRRR